MTAATACRTCGTAPRQGAEAIVSFVVAVFSESRYALDGDLRVNYQRWSPR
jgi:hypothetical protein